MVKERLTEEIERRIEESDTISADDLDVEQQCAYCERPMPYEDYNEHTPMADYIYHIVPTAGERTPPEKRIYCKPDCLVKDVRASEEEFHRR